MNMKTFYAALAFVLIVLAGTEFAMSWGMGLRMPGMPVQAQTQANATWNWTHNAQYAGANGTWNATYRGMGPGMREARPERGFAQNSTANATLMSEFRQAVASGDYPKALQLHEQYGLGGPLFERLNATTFATYSQMYNLETQLRSLALQFWSQLGGPSAQEPWQDVDNSTSGVPPEPPRGEGRFFGMPGRGMNGGKGMRAQR